ncbi:MAG TPA: hypothetical protein DCY89_01595 [Gammaproteobacteria bacterium]|nr:hypothetical protein [Gammaproteobacteria bacterium]
MSVRLARLLLPMVLVPLAHAAEPTVVLRLERAVERPFGVMLGDLVHTDVLIELNHPWRLDVASLGGPGARDYWVDLVEQTVREEALPESHRYIVSQTYQMFYFSRESKAMMVPPATVRLIGGGEPMLVPLPPLEVTSSPLVETAGLRRDEQGYYMRPDSRPLLRDPEPHRQRATLYALLAVLPALVLAWQAGWFSRQLRPFARAWRAVRRQSQDGTQLTTLRAALLHVHRALDETAGRPVFLSDLPGFLEGFPAYGDLRPRLEAFYADSRMVFFGNQDEASSSVVTRLDAVRDLLAHLARAEARA